MIQELELDKTHLKVFKEEFNNNGLFQNYVKQADEGTTPIDVRLLMKAVMVYEKIC